MAGRLFEFGPYRLNVPERLLLRGSDVLPLTPKAFDTLVLLVGHSGRLVTTDELLQGLWPGAHVEENNLAQNISLLRRTLKDDVNGSSYIETCRRLAIDSFARCVTSMPSLRRPLSPRRHRRRRIVACDGCGSGAPAARRRCESHRVPQTITRRHSRPMDGKSCFARNGTAAECTESRPVFAAHYFRSSYATWFPVV
jgi:hypothetical protein